MPAGRLHLHRSNRTERLVQALAEVLRSPTGDGFSRDLVAVHSQGLERWLAMQLAHALDICANVDFVFPDALFARAFEALHPAQGPSAWSADPLMWSVHAALGTRLDDPHFAQVKQWVQDDGPEHAPRRLLDLSTRIAALFERYATYRAHEVSGWTTQSSDWQEVLWATVKAQTGASDPAAAAQAFLEALDADPVDLGDLPARICLFSVSTLPPLHVQMLARLARHREVHLFVLSASPTVADGVRQQRDTLRQHPGMPPADAVHTTSRHPLLASMGGLARDFQVAIETADPPYLEPDPDRFEAPGDDTLLHALQTDLLHDRLGDRDRRPPDTSSIRLHSCHSPMRQVQVLRDLILARFEEDPALQPREVLVMTPDMETYAPLVAAVFSDGERWEKRDQHPGGLPALPYRLADRGPRAANPAAAALLRALQVLPGRLEASDALDLLTLPAVRGHLGITSDQWTQVRTWIGESGARWGADQAHREAEGLPATDLFTWRFALDRMLLGQALTDPREVVLGTAPLGDIEGTEHRTLLAGLVGFGEAMLAHRDALRGFHALPAWRDKLFALSTALVGPRGWRVQAVRDGINACVDAADQAGFTGTLDLAAVRGLLEGRFTLSTPGRGYLAGGITFCQLVPMRSVPFRVVYLLGMDDGAFPRMGTRPGFDKIAAHPLLGDRASRADDRGLFLESLLSARDQIEILYTGRGQRDNEVHPPAVPVGELIDAIDQSFSTGTIDPSTQRELPVSKTLTVHHPMQPFSPEPFACGPGETPTGFDKRTFSAAEAWIDGLGQTPQPRDFITQPLAPPKLTELRLTQLIRFLQHPMKWFCERRLGVWFRDAPTPVADREPVEPPDALARWALTTQLVKDAIAGRSLVRGADPHRETLRAGKLPLGTPGAVIWDALAEQAQDLANRYTRHATQAPSHVDIDQTIRGLRLTDRIDHCQPTGQIVWRAGRVREKYAIELWVRHLALAAQGHTGQSHLFGRADHAGFGPVDPDTATAHLTALVDLFLVGQTCPLLFFPATSAAWLRAYENAEGDQKKWAGWHAAKKKWNGYDEPGEAGTWVLGSTNPFWPYTDLGALPIPDGRDLEGLAQTVYPPMWDRQIDEPSP